MFRILILSFLFINSIYADNLLIHKKLIPITLLQIDNIVKKKIKKIHLILIVNKDEEIKALKLKDLLPKTIKDYNLNIDIIYESKLTEYIFDNSKDIDALYCFDLKDSSYQVINTLSNQNKIPTFSYSKIGLSNGILLYIDFTTKIKIYLNKQTMKKAKINFNNRFLRMVNIYDK